MTYITRRNAAYYLNLRLPKYLFPARNTLRLSLNIRDRQTAAFLASSIVQQLHQHLSEHPTTSIEGLRLLCATWRDTSPTRRALIQSRASATAAPIRTEEGPTLGELAKTYLKEGKAGGTWREVSTHEVERALRDLFDLVGDMPVASFDAHHARLLKDRLTRCPQYFALLPQFKGKALIEVIESGATYKTITAVTVNNRLRKLSAFMNWCKTNGYVHENPLAGLKAMTGSAKDARLSFDPSDLTSLLQLDSLEAEARKHPWRYWLPLLGRFTGARLEELCQLRVADFVQLQGIECVRIDDSHASQNLKNTSSRRTLPIHRTLIELGLLEFVEGIRNENTERLFPDLRPARGKLGHAPSKWFSRYKMKVGVTDPKKTFHSFRHTIIDDLRNAGVQDSLIKRIVGHEDSAVTFALYGSRLPLAAMVDAFNNISGVQLRTLSTPC